MSLVLLVSLKSSPLCGGLFGNDIGLVYNTVGNGHSKNTTLGVLTNNVYNSERNLSHTYREGLKSIRSTFEHKSLVIYANGSKNGLEVRMESERSLNWWWVWWTHVLFSSKITRHAYTAKLNLLAISVAEIKSKLV